MKRLHLLGIYVGTTLIFCLNSCINKDYDWDNLNKEITFQIGNVPLGDVAPIKIDSILSDRGSTEFIYDDDGYISLQYKGEIGIDLPNFGEIEMKDKETKKVDLKSKLPAIPSLPLPTPTDPIELISGTVDYVIPAPENNSTDWDLDITAVEFESCDLVLKVYMTNIEIPEGDQAKLQIKIDFPESILFDDDQIQDHSYTYELDPQLITSNGGVYTLTRFSIRKFSYDTGDDNEDITYNVGLTISDGFTYAFRNDPDPESQFYMVFSTPDPVAETVYAHALFLQEVQDEITGIGAINDIFKEEDSFSLRNPGMLFNLSTNIGFDMNVSIDKFEGQNKQTGAEKEMPDITGDGGLLFEAANASLDHTTSYYIARSNDLSYPSSNYVYTDLNEILSIKPEELTYQITARTQGEEKIPGYFPYNKPEINANYEFLIPFDFEEVTIHFEEKMKNVFTEDIAEKLFYNAGELFIIADLVEVQLGGPGSQADVDIRTTIVVYDRYDEIIDVDVKSASLKNGENTLEITIDVQEKDTHKMQNAKHLGFNFTLQGSDVVLHQTDHITIKKLKFKTTAGISWEF
ncbi:MAG: hypothetical protein LUF85_16170 [Bacteroides sp.]|nr:hypothetical protein [Bacteroides sp.]